MEYKYEYETKKSILLHERMIELSYCLSQLEEIFSLYSNDFTEQEREMFLLAVKNERSDLERLVTRFYVMQADNPELPQAAMEIIDNLYTPLELVLNEQAGEEKIKKTHEIFKASSKKYADMVFNTNTDNIDSVEFKKELRAFSEELDKSINEVW